MIWRGHHGAKRAAQRRVHIEISFVVGRITFFRLQIVSVKNYHMVGTEIEGIVGSWHAPLLNNKILGHKVHVMVSKHVVPRAYKRIPEVQALVTLFGAIIEIPQLENGIRFALGDGSHERFQSLHRPWC